MLAYFDLPIGWGELLKRTFKELNADNGLGLAAQLAYYFFFALFPALIFLLALAGFFASADLVGRVVDMMSGAVPPDVVEIVGTQLTKIVESDSGGLLTFGIAAAVWTSSSAMVALIDALNRSYDVQDARPWWKQRGIAVLLTIGVAVFILVSVALVVAGPELAELVAGKVGLGTAFEWTWKIVQWPIVFALIATALALIYFFAPDVEQDWVWITPGSLSATVLWIGGSLGFRYYVVNFGSYNETYGAIGGVMVLMLWLYISGLVIIVGAELNSEIEHASPYGKDEGEKVPGRKRVIGPRAAREYLTRLHGRPVDPPRAEPPAPAEKPESRGGRRAARAGVLLGGALVALFGRRAKH